MVYLVRHAHAGSQKQWPGPDRDRPLSVRGREQANGLVVTLAGHPVARILSSPTARCHDSVVPLSHRRGVPVELASSLDLRAPVERLLELVLDSATQAAVLCGHGEQLRGLLHLLAGGAGLDGRCGWRRDRSGCWTPAPARSAPPTICHRCDASAWASSSSCPQRLARFACSGWPAHRPRGSGLRPTAIRSGSPRRSAPCSVALAFTLTAVPVLGWTLLAAVTTLALVDVAHTAARRRSPSLLERLLPHRPDAN